MLSACRDRDAIRAHRRLAQRADANTGGRQPEPFATGGSLLPSHPVDGAGIGGHGCFRRPRDPRSVSRGRDFGLRVGRWNHRVHSVRPVHVRGWIHRLLNLLAGSDRSSAHDLEAHLPFAVERPRGP